MKPLLAPLLLIAATVCAMAQPQINRSTFGGGGQCSGGAYVLRGTIGQQMAVASSADGYVVKGGFWSAFAAVQTEGAPVLRILQSGPYLILAWPRSSTGFQLQESSSLVTPRWTDVSALPEVVGDDLHVSQRLTRETRFFRLRKSE